MSTVFSNITIPVPFGTTTHGNPHLLCRPSNWSSIAYFFLANYITHAATVLSFPGELPFHYAVGVLLALMFPTSGCFRGLNAIFRFANLQKDDLTKAARAGALCMVVRTSGRGERSRYDAREPENIQQYHRTWWAFNDIEPPSNKLQHRRTIHGVSRNTELPTGYIFAPVPRDARVTPRGTTSPASDSGSSGKSSSAPNLPDVTISASSNAPKIIIAIFQTMYGSITLYRARGDQINRYGYAAFGLTVTPYVVMSIMNLMGCLMTPSYPTMYLVHSKALDEISGIDGHPYLDGTVGTYEEVPSNQIRRGYAIPWNLQSDRYRVNPELAVPIYTGWRITATTGLALMLSLGIPLIIIGAISKFRKGDSTQAQQVWTMAWLAFSGAVEALRALSVLFWTKPSQYQMFFSEVKMAAKVVLTLIYGTPAVGGVIIVGRMLKEYGDCIRLT